MDQEKIGKFIKEIRQNNNLTQKEFADKFGVTYQAVSKWENGKNIPDVGILKEISKQYNINIDDILEGKTTKNKKSNLPLVYFIIIIPIAIISIYLFFHSSSDKNFQFKTISSSCTNFKLTGSAAYNREKTAIFISNVEFCGKEDKEIYEKIECNLYEKHKEEKIKISACNSKENTKLDDYLKEVKINVNNYSSKCRSLTSNDLILEISATKKEGKVVLYNVPIKLNEQCK